MDKQVRELFETTDLYYREIADRVGTTYKVVTRIIYRHYTKEQIRDRASRSYSRTKKCDSNHMRGKTGSAHPNYKGEVPDGNGYVMVLKPDWYTGRPGSKHVFKHSVVFCEAAGLTEIPAGFVVHHIDGDKLHNDPNNLALMTVGAHGRLHSLERATTSRVA